MATLISDILQCTLEYLGIRDIVLSSKLYRNLLRELNSCCASHKILHLVAEKLVMGSAKICRESTYGKVVGFYKGIAISRESRVPEQYDTVIKDFREQCARDISPLFNKIFAKLYPKSPLIVFDAILWELHHVNEKKGALKQLLFSLNVVRRYLTDLSMVVISPSMEIRAFLESFKNRITIINWPHRMQTNHGLTIVLDPYADRALTEVEVMKADTFVIGLLVDDMFSRPFATYLMTLLRNLKDCERRAIVYKEHIVGVPREINKIVEILLKVRFEGASISTAVKEVMGVDDKIKRLTREAAKYCNMGKAVDKNVVKSLMMELGLDERYYGKVLSRVRKLSCWRE